MDSNKIINENKSYEGFMIYNLSNIGGGYILSNTVESRQQCLKVPCVGIKISTLDQEIKDKKIDLLKIDAEGAESWILEGAHTILKNNPDLILMLEWDIHHMQRNKISIDSFIQFLKNKGLNVWRVDRDHAGSLIALSFEDLKKPVAMDIVLSKRDIFKEYFS